MPVVHLSTEIEDRLSAFAIIIVSPKSHHVRAVLVAQMTELDNFFLSEQCLIDSRFGRTDSLSHISHISPVALC